MSTSKNVKRRGCCALMQVKRDNSSFLRSNVSSIVVREKDELAPLLTLEDGFVNRCDDTILLLNQRRLSTLDPKAVADIVRRRFSEHNASSVMEGLTDEQIFDAMKGRHIQSLSELDRYSEFLASSLKDSIDFAAQSQSKEKMLDAEPSSGHDPSPSE